MGKSSSLRDPLVHRDQEGTEPLLKGYLDSTKWYAYIVNAIYALLTIIFVVVIFQSALNIYRSPSPPLFGMDNSPVFGGALLVSTLVMWYLIRD